MAVEIEVDDDMIIPPPSPPPPKRDLEDIQDVGEEELEDPEGLEDQPEESSSPATEQFATVLSPSASELSSDSVATTPSIAPSSIRTSLTESHSALASMSDSCLPSGILQPTTLPRSHSFTVTFAPLPELDPRRRTSTIPLGVAARSRLLRARRMKSLSSVEAVEHIPDEGVAYSHFSAPLEQPEAAHIAQPFEAETTVQIYSGDEAASAQGSSARKPPAPFQSIWRSAPSGLARPDEETAQDQDALLALGRMIQGGARTLWRRVSKGSLRPQGALKNADASQETGAEVEVAIVGVGVTKRRPLLRRTASEPQNLSDITETGNLTVRVLVQEPRQLLADEEERESLTVTPQYVEEEQGRVWEEQVGDDVTRRMQALSEAQAQDKLQDKDKGTGLIRRFASLRSSRKLR